MELIDNKIITLKTHNSNHHPTDTSSLKTTAVKNSIQQIPDQFVVTPVDKANGNVAFIFKRFFIEVLLKELRMNPYGISNKSDTYDMGDINDQLLISQLPEYLQKQFKLKDSQDSQVCRLFTGSPNCTKIPPLIDLS